MVSIHMTGSIVINTFCKDFSLQEHRTVCVRFEVFTTVTMKNGVFWDVTLCGSCKNRRFGGT
jgi:hypothetical protein